MISIAFIKEFVCFSLFFVKQRSLAQGCAPAYAPHIYMPFRCFFLRGVRPHMRRIYIYIQDLLRLASLRCTNLVSDRECGPLEKMSMKMKYT